MCIHYFVNKAVLKMSKRQIKADQTFEKVLKDHVKNQGRRTLCISIRGSQAVLSGEEDSVVLAKANLEEMTIADLIEAMKVMENQQDAQNYKTTEKISFPAMKVKFKGRRWSLQAAREQLSIIMNILGFGKGGTKKFKVAAHEPEGWPDEHSFVVFDHPSYANLRTANDIIEGILGFHGIDAKSHPYTGEEPKTPPPKKKKAKAVEKRVQVEENLIDPNDNSITSDEEEALPVAGPSRIVSRKRVLSPYEAMRENNIAELREAMDEAGVMPHSKVRKTWEDCSDFEFESDQ